MILCPKCSVENTPDSRFCKSCAEPLSTPSQMPTMEAPAAETPKVAETPHVARIISSDSIPAGGFTPGMILVDRYRVIGLLGRGGMGEVYRADDLKLGQPVALKFLPPKLAQDAVRRERFFAEVRITRQLSHPNICRVYDIQEFEGHHYLSMEFIDGEDLASLLKRIGHLTNEKALDIARQLAAGLAAAHERGVLHRDLKPANIMLDGHGRVRITDFGLAIAAEDEGQAVEIAGTPAYMAPEQLAGKGATVRSDIYSLGLILYEIYTGKKAFTATTLAELRDQKETQTPRAPSEIRTGIDPVVERLIQRCMEKDPNARPASVAQLAQALPGGDPLAAAIAAGETPSPEMVAASGSKEGLRPAVAWGLLGIIIVGMLAIIVMNNRSILYRRIPFEKPPDSMAELSRQFLEKSGHYDESAYNIYGFMVNTNLLRYIERTDRSANRWKKLDSKAIIFWYRQSPSRLASTSEISFNTPTLQIPGELLLILDTKGRLVTFQAIPPAVRSSTMKAREPNWTIFFEEAGLVQSQWKEKDSEFNPSSYADTLETWEGSLQTFPDTPVRIEASALQGKVFGFRIIGPWEEPSYSAQLSIREVIGAIGALIILLPTIVGGIFLARRNLRLGRGDRRNATRLAIFILILSILQSVSAIPRSSFISLLLAPYIAGIVWIMYLAIEPYVRRRWPQVLISWTRLLSGHWKDPLIARDVLIACAASLFVRSVVWFTYYFIPLWFGESELAPPTTPPLDVLMGSRFFVSTILGSIIGTIWAGLALLFLLFLMKLLLRNQTAAFISCILIFSLINAPGNLWAFLIILVLCPVFFIVLIRFGILPAIIALFVDACIHRFPVILESPKWYSGYSYATLLILATVILYAFRTSLGGRPILGTPRLDE